MGGANNKPLSGNVASFLDILWSMSATSTVCRGPRAGDGAFCVHLRFLRAQGKSIYEMLALKMV